MLEDFRLAKNKPDWRMPSGNARGMRLRPFLAARSSWSGGLTPWY